jgi:hypothetical protein
MTIIKEKSIKHLLVTEKRKKKKTNKQVNHDIKQSHIISLSIKNTN